MQEPSRLCIFGAGSIGCYVGGRLAAAGVDITLIGRPRMQETLAATGITLSDYQGYHQSLAKGTPAFVTGAAAAGDADVIFLTVKSAATRTAARELKPYLSPGTRVVSLQNGVGNADLLRTLLPEQVILAGMVPFNVLQQRPGHFHQGSEGHLTVAADPVMDPLKADFARAGLPLEQRRNMVDVLWGKLLLNLNNPINALADIPLKAQLSQRDFRRCLVLAQRETLGLLKVAGITPARVTPLRPHWLPRVLALPDPLFARIAGKMLAIDPVARSSMWEDLHLGRKTEIDYINCAVSDLATRLGREAPINRRLVDLIHNSEAGTRQAWSGSALLQHLSR